MIYNTRNIPNFTYDELDSFLGGKQEKKICNLTYAIRMETGRIVVQYESGGQFGSYNQGERNTIATYRKSGSSSFTDAYWQTNTTKGRLNQLLPDGHIYQQDFAWYFAVGDKTFELDGGESIEFDGQKFIDVIGR